MSDAIEEESLSIRVGANPGRAQRVIDWIETHLTTPTGKFVGQPFRLAEFQKDFIRAIYEPVDLDAPDERLVNRAILSVGRQSGKSEVAAALVLVNLLGPESRFNNLIVSGAKTRRQAKVVFDKVVKFLRLAPQLQKYVRIVDSTSTIAVVASGKRCEGSKYIAISSDAGGAQGLSIDVAIMDELAQSNADFYKALESGQGARNGLMIVISTQSHDPNHILSRLIRYGLSGRNPKVTARLYAAPEGCDLMDEAAWEAANPGLDLWIDRKTFRADAMQARDNPADEAHFRLYRLNQQVSDLTIVVPMHQWREARIEGPDDDVRRSQSGELGLWSYDFPPGSPIYLGLDLAQSGGDLAALSAILADGDLTFSKTWFWKPADGLKKASEGDQEPYEVWRDRGWLMACPGPLITPEAIVERIVDLMTRFRVKGLAYDRKFMPNVLALLAREGVNAREDDKGDLRVIPWGQGMGPDMTTGIAALQKAAKLGTLRHDGNPLLTKNMMNALIQIGDTDYMMFSKKRSITRIDGAVALAMAFGLRDRDRTAEPITSVFDDPEFDYSKIVGF